MTSKFGWVIVGISLFVCACGQRPAQTSHDVDTASAEWTPPGEDLEFGGDKEAHGRDAVAKSVDLHPNRAEIPQHGRVHAALQ